MCSSFNNNHINSIKNYEKLMKERNKLLQDNLYDKSWLETIEERMVSEGILIGLTRIELIKRLNNSLEKDQNPVWPRAFLKIQGTIEEKLIFSELNEVREAYIELLFNRFNCMNSNSFKIQDKINLNFIICYKYLYIIE